MQDEIIEMLGFFLFKIVKYAQIFNPSSTFFPALQYALLYSALSPFL